MRAAVLEHYGEPDAFTVKNIATPEIKNGQLLIANKASSVNPVDVLVRKGKTKLLTGLMGEHLIGSDFCGTVIDSKSNRFKAGDEVFGMNNAVTGGGAYAEQIVADENATALKPANLTFAQAAVLPLVTLTAWQSLVDEGKIGNGYRVLILGCTGGVGIPAVQIAHTFNATVTGTCSGKHMPFAKSLGINHVVDYQNMDALKDEKFDLIFDTSGHFTISDLKNSLTEEAMFVSTRGGTDDLTGVAEALLDLTFKKRMKIVRVSANPTDLDNIRAMAETGALTPHIAATFPLEQLAEAHRMQEAGGFTGKIAITV
ncbi:NAD(P)-dependent alcohol dehydrogenase [Parapedobacter pyrenivorans]|uniref:NAD(P)-dependent alcohol dehydrogenase n=1 Tax=Parapedobacter pyrenivorans TaxID=1305674 RepID=UPI00333FB71B